MLARSASRLVARGAAAAARAGAVRPLASARNASTLVIAEVQDGALGAPTLHSVKAATTIGGPVTVLVAGSDCAGAAAEAAELEGVDAVLHADDAAYDHAIAENVTGLVVACHEAGDGFSHIVACATNEGKNVIPRIAGVLDVAPLTDVMEIKDEDTFVRPMYAGNVIATVKSKDSVKCFTVRATSYEKAEAGGGAADVSAADGPGDAGLTSWVSDEVSGGDRPDLTAASIVVAGGRGLQNGENFDTVLAPLVDKLGAAMGASRAAVDAGFVPNELQIGQTGKVVAPELYMAVGISGAIQHVAGMKDSKTIVCINTDEEAPIFQISDYGLKADLFDAVPEIITELDKE